MVGHTIWACSNCGFDILTSSPQEFYRDDEGNMKPYGHPTPWSEEAAQHGVKGFYADWYCPTCGKIKQTIYHEFESPMFQRGWWHRLIEDEYNVLKLKPGEHRKLYCECRAQLESDLGNEMCPKCKKGTLKEKNSC